MTGAPQFVPYAGNSGLYRLDTGEQDSPYGWVGYVMSDNDTPKPDQPVSTADAFNIYKGSYLFARAEPAAIANLADLTNQFVTNANPTWRAAIWLADATQQNPLPTAQPSRFAIFFAWNALSSLYQSKGNFSAWLGSYNGFTFSVSNNSQVGWDDGQQALTFLGSTSFLYAPQSPRSDQMPAVPNSGNGGLSVVTSSGQLVADTIAPLIGNRAGSFLLTTQMAPAITFPITEAGFQYWASTASGDVAFAYPAFVSAANPINLATAIDPIDLTNTGIPQDGAPFSLAGGEVRTGFTALDQNATWTSCFRTEEGRTISLTPIGGGSGLPFAGPSPFAGGFAFASQQPAVQTPGPGSGLFRFTPTGDYGVSVDGVAPGTAGQTMLCGLFGSERLSFTSFTPGVEPAGARLRFQVNNPAYAPIFPFPVANMANPTAGAVAQQRLYPTYATAWAHLIDDTGLYRAEPDGGAYYGPGSTAPGASNGGPVLGPTPPGTAVPQTDGFFFPLAPYAAYQPDPSWSQPNAPLTPQTATSDYESQILSATRKSLFGGPGSEAREARRLRHVGRLELRAQGAADSSEGWTTTRQGLLAQMSPAPGATDFLEVILAQYVSRSGSPTPWFGFGSPGHIVQEALQTNQLFAVMVNATPLGQPPPAAAPNFYNIVDIEDWQFDVDVGAGVQATDYQNILILKYCDGTLCDWVKNPNKWTDAEDFSLIANAPAESSIAYTGLSTWLTNYLDDAIQKAANSPPGKTNLYANIAAIAQQPDWKGFLALRASLPPASALPPQIEGLASGIDPKHFFAHHFGATLSRVKPDSTDPNKLVIDGVSSLFGLIDYQDPLYLASINAGADPDTPLPIDATDPFDFRVLNLQALFVNAKMTDFESRIQLSINQYFGAPVATTQRNDPNNPGSWLTQPANGIVLDGSAVNQNGTTVYVFQQNNPTLFTFETPALNAITVSQVQFNTLGVANWEWPSGSVPTITSRFLFWGAFDFPKLGTEAEPYDLLSFGSDPPAEPLGQGLAYSNLQVTMRAPQANPGVTNFTFDPSNLAFDLGASNPRPGGLFSNLALQLQSFIFAPAGRTPLDFGFLTVAPEGLEVSELADGWCGIVHKINMGGPGALVSAAGFNSQLLVAWSPVPSPNPALFVGLSLPGTAPGASVFSLQGVFKITTGSILLQCAPPTGGATEPSFSIQLSNIGATFLGIMKIPDGTIQFFLFGDPSGSGSVGWYAAYKAPADDDDGTLALPAPAEQDR